MDEDNNKTIGCEQEMILKIPTWLYPEAVKEDEITIIITSQSVKFSEGNPHLASASSMDSICMAKGPVAQTCSMGWGHTCRALCVASQLNGNMGKLPGTYGKWWLYNDNDYDNDNGIWAITQKTEA